MKKNFKILSRDIRVNLLNTTYHAKSSHIGSCLSIVEILIAIHYELIKRNDQFILSKGHAGLAMYCLLYEKKYISLKTLNSYGKDKSILMGHISHKVKGVEFSTGSLGHGLPVAVGKAFKSKRFKNKNNIYVLLSDGELNEGSTWESLLFASHHKLDNLNIIVDYNKIQSMGPIDKIINLEPLKEKFESFGCDVMEVDGHNIKQIQKSLKKKSVTKPKLIIAHTTKGKGVHFMENNNLWHYRPPNQKELMEALKEVNKNA